MRTLNDNDTINDLVQALVYAKHLIDSPSESSAAERAATLVHIDELIYLHSARQDHSNEYESVDSSGELRTSNVPKREF